MSGRQIIVSLVSLSGFLCNALLWLHLGALSAEASPGLDITLGRVEFLVFALIAAGGFSVATAFAVLNPVLEERKENGQ